jgi:hypothetical protein
MSIPGGGPQEPEMTEEQLRQLDAEIERIHVDDVILQTIVSLINLGARKGAIGAPPEAGIRPDYPQLKIAIDAATGLVDTIEARHTDKLNPIRNAIAELQRAYVAGTGKAAPAAPAEAAADPAPQGGAGPAKSSGRLWVPGQ